jgi:hypothetical protein
MSSIRWLLAVLRKLILGNTLVRASIRGLLFLFFALCRGTKTRPGLASKDPQPNRFVYPQADDDGGKNPYPALPVDSETRVVYTSASSLPASRHPYLNSASSASRSSQDIAAHPLTQEPYYSMYSSSIQLCLSPCTYRPQSFSAVSIPDVTALAKPPLTWLFAVHKQQRCGLASRWPCYRVTQSVETILRA